MDKYPSSSYAFPKLNSKNYNCDPNVADNTSVWSKSVLPSAISQRYQEYSSSSLRHVTNKDKQKQKTKHGSYVELHSPNHSAEGASIIQNQKEFPFPGTRMAPFSNHYYLEKRYEHSRKPEGESSFPDRNSIPGTSYHALPPPRASGVFHDSNHHRSDSVPNRLQHLSPKNISPRCYKKSPYLSQVHFRDNSEDCRECISSNSEPKTFSNISFATPQEIQPQLSSPFHSHEALASVWPREDFPLTVHDETRVVHSYEKSGQYSDDPIQLFPASVAVDSEQRQGERPTEYYERSCPSTDSWGSIRGNQPYTISQAGAEDLVYDFPKVSNFIVCEPIPHPSESYPSLPVSSPAMPRVFGDEIDLSCSQVREERFETPSPRTRETPLVNLVSTQPNVHSVPQTCASNSLDYESVIKYPVLDLSKRNKLSSSEDGAKSFSSQPLPSLYDSIINRAEPVTSDGPLKPSSLSPQGQTKKKMEFFNLPQKSSSTRSFSRIKQQRLNPIFEAAHCEIFGVRPLSPNPRARTYCSSSSMEAYSSSDEDYSSNDCDSNSLDSSENSLSKWAFDVSVLSIEQVLAKVQIPMLEDHEPDMETLKDYLNSHDIGHINYIIRCYFDALFSINIPIKFKNLRTFSPINYLSIHMHGVLQIYYIFYKSKDFQSLEADDQASLLEVNTVPALILFGLPFYDHSDRSWAIPIGNKRVSFPLYISNLLHIVSQSVIGKLASFYDIVKDLHLDRIMSLILIFIIIYTPVNKCIEKLDFVDKLRDKYVKILFQYTKWKLGESNALPAFTEILKILDVLLKFSEELNPYILRLNGDERDILEKQLKSMEEANKFQDGNKTDKNSSSAEEGWTFKSFHIRLSHIFFSIGKGINNGVQHGEDAKLKKEKENRRIGKISFTRLGKSTKTHACQCHRHTMPLKKIKKERKKRRKEREERL